MSGRPFYHTRASRTHTNNLTDANDSSKVRDFFKREMHIARRNGSWFRLGGVERGVYGLAMRLDVKLQSSALLKALVSVLKKLKEAGDVAYATLTQGMKLAWSFSDWAVSWGNASAREWRNDREYAMYLGRSLLRRGWG